MLVDVLDQRVPHDVGHRLAPPGRDALRCIPQLVVDSDGMLRGRSRVRPRGHVLTVAHCLCVASTVALLYPYGDGAVNAPHGGSHPAWPYTPRGDELVVVQGVGVGGEPQLSLLTPALLGALITMTWWGALKAFFWAGLVRVAVLHHVTWSINSICHMAGRRPFGTRDRSANVWWLAVLSFGESWHNLHHADPTCARHGVKRGQIDMSARLIWLFEKFGWVHSVRWPTPQRLERLARRSAA